MATTNTQTVEVSPNWPNSSNGKAVIYIQAWATSSFVQNISITGNGITNPLTKSSDNSKPFGSQFYNTSFTLDYSQFPGWQFTVTITYTDSEGKQQDSDVLGTNDLQIGDHMYTAFVISNDGGTDNDYNDCVVQISAFNDSTDG